MKILMPNHFPLQGSGSGIYALNVALELLRAGHEVMAIVPEHRPVDEYPFETRAIIFRDPDGAGGGAQLDFNFPCFTTHPRSTITFAELSDTQMEAYVRAWRVAIGDAITDFKPDVIHAHHVWVTPCIAAETHVPYIVTCHGTDLLGFAQCARYREMALAGANGAHKIIAISRQVKTDVVETYGVADNRAVLIWNGFGVDHFKLIPDATKTAVLAEHNLPPADGPLISFVGKFTEFKGIDVLLRAAKIYEQHLGGAMTVLAGDGQLWDEMHALRDELDLTGVHFLGHQSQDKVSRIYNAADVSVVPSRFEAFGLVAIEALACGTPVVATNEGGLPDFINDEVGALVPVDDPEALAAAIISEIEQNSKQTKGPNANRYAYQNFTWETQVAMMIDLYREAIAR
ncbi:MAG: glycosyltransferase family 4 protein [Phycisphaerae bacterium]|jgi:glycosyltransferase involved in cell wall biosynthesis|nr:glycosyltransferase family 4 protein [Phycisphaerae bacterium]